MRLPEVSVVTPPSAWRASFPRNRSTCTYSVLLQIHKQFANLEPQPLTEPGESPGTVVVLHCTVYPPSRPIRGRQRGPATG